MENTEPDNEVSYSFCLDYLLFGFLRLILRVSTWSWNCSACGGGLLRSTVYPVDGRQKPGWPSNDSCTASGGDMVICKM